MNHQKPRTRVGHTTPNTWGVDVFVWDEAKVAAMVNAIISVTSGSYGGAGNNAGWAYLTLAGVKQSGGVNAQGYGAASGATTTVNNPSPAAFDFGFIAASHGISSISFTGFSAGYTERIDGSPGGMRMGIADAFSRGAESPTLTVSSAIDVKALCIGFLEEPAASTLSITSVNGGNPVTANQMNITLLGSNLGCSVRGRIIGQL